MVPFSKNSLILAPMAGVTDSGFRKLCRKYGADVTVSEMVSSKGIFYRDKKSIELLRYSDEETPIIIQIFGHDTECMKNAAEFVTANYSPISIDINMGCPAPKIFQNGDGSALMKNHELAYKIIKSVKDNTNLPVSVKFRSGVDENTICAVEFAKVCESAGADYITVHARTREQFYSGSADMDIIKQVVENISLPVVANGDIIDAKTAKYALEYTGAHSVMIGRAALGNPLLFDDIKRSFTNEESDIKISKADIALEHLSNVLENKAEHIAVKEFRKHLIWYFKGIKNAASFKRKACEVKTFDECKALLFDLKKEKPN